MYVGSLLGWVKTLLQERKAQLRLCPAATPEKLEPGQRVPCVHPEPFWLSLQKGGTNPFSTIQKALRVVAPLPFCFPNLTYPVSRDGERCLEAQMGNSQPKTSFKGEANLQRGSEQHYPALEGSEGEQRCVWDVSLTKGSNLGSSVSSQFFWVTGQIIGTILEFPPSLAMEE